MEILNKDDEIERLVVATGFDFGQQPLKKQIFQFLLNYGAESGHASSLSLSSLRRPVDALLF